MKVTDRQNNFRVSAEDMAGAIGKVGTVAQQTGMSMNKLNAITATLTGATGLSGSEIGTMEKTLLSRIFRIGEEGESDAGASEEALNNLGIAVRKSATEFRSSELIIDDVAKKYKTLTNVQQTDLAQVLGGTYHYAKVMALLSNYDTVIEANVKALNSQGSAYRENQKYLDSMQGKLAVLSTTMESKYNKALTSDTLIMFISALTNVIERLGTFNNVLVVTGILLATIKFNAVATFFSAMPLSLSAVSVALQRLVGVLGVVKVAFLSNPIGVGITAIAIAVGGLYTAYTMLNKTSEEVRNEAKASKDAFEAKRQSIESLTEAYKQNFELAKTDDKAKKQLLETEQQLKDALGLSNIELNNQNKSLEENLKKIKEVSQVRLKDYIDQNLVKNKQMQEEYNSPDKFKSSSNVNKVIKQFAEPNLIKPDGERTYDSQLASARSALSKANTSGTKEQIKLLSDEIEKIVALKKTTDDFNTSVTTAQKKFVENGITGLDKLSDSQKKVFEMAKDNIKQDPSKLFDAEEYKSQIIKVFDAVKTFTGSNTDELKKKMENLFPQEDLTKFNTEINKLSDSLFMLGMSETEIKKVQQEIDDQYKESINKIQLLQKAQNELNKDHKFSESTIEALMEKYGGLLNQQLSEEEKLKELSRLVELEGKTFSEVATLKLSKNKEFFASAIKGNSELWKSVATIYGDDLANFTTIEEAKLKIDEFITTEIANNWFALTKMQQDVVRESSNLLGELTSQDTMSYEDNYDAMMASGKVQGISGKTDEEMAKTFDSGSYKRVSEMKKAYDKMKGIAEEASKNLKTTSADLGNVSDSKSASPADVNEEAFMPEINRMERYERHLSDVNVAIAKNKSEQEQVNISTEDQIKLKEKELTLLEQQRIANNNLSAEAKQVTSELRGKMGEKFFSQDGNINLDEYNKYITNESNRINGLKGKSRSDANTNLKNFVADKKAYEDMLSKANQYEIDKSNSNGNKGKLGQDIDKIKTDSILTKQSDAITPLTQQLDKLKSSYEGLTDNQLDEKLSNINNQISNQDEQVKIKNKQIVDLDLKLTDVSISADSKKDFEAAKVKAVKEVEDLTKNGNVLGKSKVEVEVDILFNKSTKSAEQYDKFLSNLEFKESSLAESNLAGSMAVKAEMIDATTKQIELQTVELDKMNKVEDKAILNDEKFKSSKDALVKSLQSNILKVKELNKAQSEIIIKSVEDTETKVQEMIKKGLDLKKEALDKEKSDFKDFIDAKQKLLDDSYATEDYNADLKKALSERSDIQKQINALSYDQSFSSFQQRKDLEEKYSESTTKINDLQKTRNRSLEKDALADSLKAKEDSVDKTKSDLDKEFSQDKIRILAHEAVVTDSFDNIKAKFPELFKELNLQTASFVDVIKGYVLKFDEGVGSMKTTIETELVPQLLLAIKYANQLDTLKKQAKGEDTGNGGTTPPTIPPATKDAINTANNQSTTQYNNQTQTNDTIAKAKHEIGLLQDKWNELQKLVLAGTATKDQTDMMTVYHSKAQRLRNLYNLPEANYHGYANGGINTTTGLAMLHGTPSRPEVILNSANLATLVRNMSLTNFIPNIRPQTPQLAGGLSGGINLAINIAGNADNSTIGKIKESGNNILNEIKKTLAKNGVYRN